MSLESLMMVHSNTLSAIGSSEGNSRPDIVTCGGTHTYPLRISGSKTMTFMTYLRRFAMKIHQERS